jgi:spore coat polysaccharide biosynthesis protein SpsF
MMKDHSLPRVVASIEARMGSSRLPGKVLMDVCGKPALSRLVGRLRHCRRLDDIVLATTVSPSDDVLEKWAGTEGLSYYRGSEDDVLLRVVEAHRKMRTDIIVEITGDCTLTDPEIVDLGITMFLENECDVLTNVRKLSFPMGEDVQVYRLKDLEEVERTSIDPAVREHVSLFFYEHPEVYRIIHMFAPERWFGPTWRFQLDYLEDHTFINKVYEMLEPVHGETFGLEEIMSLLRQHPELVDINSRCVEKSAR